jgi:integrase
MAKVLTDVAVRNAKGGTVRQEIPDGGQRGLYLIIQPNGSKSWAIRYRHHGVPRKMTLQAGLSLAAARKLAAEAMFQVAQGIDPARAREAERERAVLADENTVQAVCERYQEIEGKSLRSARERHSILKRLVYPGLGARPIGEIERDEIVAQLDRIAKDNGPRASDMTLSILSKIFNWHEKRTSKFRSPLVRGMMRQKATERARKRVLTDDEIRKIWAACDDIGLFGPCVRFLLLTGARRNEAARMEWSEIVENVWTLPAARSKTKKDVVRPLSPAAMAIIEGVPRIAGSPFVFSHDGERPIRLDGVKMKPHLDRLAGVTDWRIHDLRRTARTLLARARVPYDIAEMALGHALKGGIIRATYDHHEYLDEKAEAFDKLAGEIDRIVSGYPGGKVIQLRS